jgi:hypothetical protein
MASSIMKWNLCLGLGLIACAVEPDTTVCEETLFGTPSVNTGLDEGQCGPSCGCGASSWHPPVYTAEDITRLEQLVLMDAPALLKEDPYLAPSSLLPSDSRYCAVTPTGEPDHYRLATYPTEQEAELDNARITHRGACGQCSSLANLAVYMRQPDLTEPVRDCGVQGMFGGEEANIECLMDIGFDRPCAQIWYFNTRHTSEVCLDVCMACIQCDEDESGPVFKAFAGRTRRNSGLPSALCRPCDSVYRVEHAGW